jgi:hypothetical protein
MEAQNVQRVCVFTRRRLLFLTRLPESGCGSKARFRKIFERSKSV